MQLYWPTTGRVRSPCSAKPGSSGITGVFIQIEIKDQNACYVFFMRKKYALHTIILDATLHHPLLLGSEEKRWRFTLSSSVLLYIQNFPANGKLVLFLGDGRQRIYFLGKLNSFTSFANILQRASFVTVLYAAMDFPLSLQSAQAFCSQNLKTSGVSNPRAVITSLQFGAVWHGFAHSDYK